MLDYFNNNDWAKLTSPGSFGLQPGASTTPMQYGPLANSNGFTRASQITPLSLPKLNIPADTSGDDLTKYASSAKMDPNLKVGSLDSTKAPAASGMTMAKGMGMAGQAILGGYNTINAASSLRGTQKTEAVADGITDTISSGLMSSGMPVLMAAGLGLKLVNGIGGSLMNNGQTGKAAKEFNVNQDVQASSGYTGVAGNATDEKGDATAYTKAGLFGKLFTNGRQLQGQLHGSEVQQNQTAGILNQNKQAINAGLNSQDMTAARVNQKLYNGDMWNNGSVTMGKEGTKIHIKKSHEGAFTTYKQRTGKTTEEALHSKDPHVRKMANFARNAAKWHQEGGLLGVIHAQQGAKLGVPKVMPQVPGNSVAPRITDFMPEKKISQVLTRSVDNATQSKYVKDSKTPVNQQQAVSSLDAPQPAMDVTNDIMSMITNALAPVGTPPANNMVDPNTLPTLQDGGTMTTNNNATFDYEEFKKKLGVPTHKDGGPINVIVEGALHARKHELGEHPDFEDAKITGKGVPVISKDGGIEQHAEVERDELILHYELTKKLESLAAEATEEAAIEAGKLLAEEIVKNTKDSSSKLLKNG